MRGLEVMVRDDRLIDCACMRVLIADEMSDNEGGRIGGLLMGEWRLLNADEEVLNKCCCWEYRHGDVAVTFVRTDASTIDILISHAYCWNRRDTQILSITYCIVIPQCAQQHQGRRFLCTTNVS